jgi:hypothetical protein
MPPNTPSSPKHILAAVGSQNHFWPLLSLGYALAKHRQCQFRVIYVNQSGQSPDWLRIPSAYDDLEIEIEVVSGASPANTILAYARKNTPGLLLVGWPKQDMQKTPLTGGTLMPGADGKVGTLTVNGDVVMDADSTLAFNLESDASYSVLDVKGSLALTGTLSLSYLNGYTPTEGVTEQTIITTTGGVTGAFDTVPEGASVTIVGNNVVLDFPPVGTTITIK